MPAVARITDRHSCSDHPPNVVVDGEATVIIGHQPVARVSDAQACGSKITKGETSVVIEGKNPARKGDPTSHGGVIASGDPTVIIGSNPSTVLKTDKPFCEECAKKAAERKKREQAERTSA